MNPAIGIDLGTTNTVVGVQTGPYGPEVLEIPQPRVERNTTEDLPQIKSAVLFESNRTALVGAMAMPRPEAFRSIKSRMGTRWRASHAGFDKPLSAPYISAHVLKLAEQTIASRYPDWDRTAVVTVPASFSSEQRSDTMRAARLAGIRADLIDEPTAAFYYYFCQYAESGDFDQDRFALVFDFGGGTLDVSVIHLRHDGPSMVIDTVGRSRYNNLGGDDIDVDLASYLLAAWDHANGRELFKLSPDRRTQLYQLFVRKAMEYKEQCEYNLLLLLELPEFVVDEGIGDGADKLKVRFHRSMTRAEYDDFTGRYFNPGRSELNIFRPVVEAIELTKQIVPDFSRDKLDFLLYTGGASMMSGVRTALNAYFAPQPCFSINEAESFNTVALGAAFYRYHQQQGNRDIRMTNRLLESILTRTNDGSKFVEIVPLVCRPSEHFIDSGYPFQTQRDLISLKQPMFRGVGPDDYQLARMPDLEVSLKKPVARGTEYRIAYRMTEDKTIELRVTFQAGEEVVIAVDPFSGRPEMAPAVTQVCKVNPIGGRV